MIFVTDMDNDNASYRQVVQDLQDMYGKCIAPFHLPVRENKEFVGYVNVLQQRAKRWTSHGDVEKMDVPEYSKENLNICRAALMEAVAADYIFRISPMLFLFRPQCRFCLI